MAQQIPKNPYDKNMKNSLVKVDNFIYAEMQKNRKSFYVYCGKNRRRIYQGSCAKEI